MPILDRPATAARRSPPGPVAVLPGLLAAVAAAGAGYLVNHWIGAASPLIVAVILGVLLTGFGYRRRWLQPGLRLASSTVLRAGVVLLGLQLVLSDIVRLGAGVIIVTLLSVVAAFVVTNWAGRVLGLNPARSLLVATGVAICGASAVAGMNQVADGEEDDVVTAVAVVTALGTLSLAAVPLLGALLGLDDALLGLWTGASVHEVGQVVAIGGMVGGGALSVAVVVKLFRVLLLAPLVAVVAVRRRRARDGDHGDGATPPLVPWFVAGFVAMAALRSTGWLHGGVVTTASTVGTVLLAAAMFALGAAVDLRSIARGGRQALTAGAIGTAALAAVSLGGLALVA